MTRRQSPFKLALAVMPCGERERVIKEAIAFGLPCFANSERLG
jgi:hypothetical protein